MVNADSEAYRHFHFQLSYFMSIMFFFFRKKSPGKDLEIKQSYKVHYVK